MRPLLTGACVFCGLVLLTILLDVELAYAVPAIVLVTLLGGAVALWRRANHRADGSEWWQDDEASGWRGY